MRIADAQWIPSTQHQTWDALTDPAVLQRCIPGCVNVTQRSPPSTPSPCVPRSPASTPTTTARSCCRTSIPNSCTLVFEGKGRAACLAIGTAQVNLSTKDQGTRVAYTVAGMTGGKLAECGESLILKAGEKIIERFFAAFIDYMAGQPRLAPPPAARARASRPVQLPLVLGAGAGGDRRVPELPHPLQVVDSLANRDGCGHSAVIC